MNCDFAFAVAKIVFDSIVVVVVVVVRSIQVLSASMRCFSTRCAT